MSIFSPCYEVASKFGNLLKSKDGNFALLTAVIAPVVLVAGGLALDVANMNSLKGRLQAASDSVALVIATRIAKGNLSVDEAEAYGGTDCNDEQATVHPGAYENYYDGLDANCDGLSDYDADEDGFDSDNFGGDDCDDTDFNINPNGVEVPRDGIDQDCDGLFDYDQDADGEPSVWYGGTDCNDLDPLIFSMAIEVYYDGVDQNCDGQSDYDADGDGQDSNQYGGDDCEDSNA